MWTWPSHSRSVPLADGVAGRGLLPPAVERHDGRPLERRDVEGAGRVGQVMRDEMPAEGAVGTHAAEPSREGGAALRRRAAGEH